MALYLILSLIAGALLYKTFVADPQRERDRLLVQINEALGSVTFELDDDDDPEDTFEAALTSLLDADDFLVPDSWTFSGGSVECGDEVLPALILKLGMNSGEALGPFLVPFHEGGTEEFRALVSDGLDEATRLAAEDQ